MDPAYVTNIESYHNTSILIEVLKFESMLIFREELDSERDYFN